MQFGCARQPKICDSAVCTAGKIRLACSPKALFSGQEFPLLTPPDSLSRECENGFHFRIDDTRLYWRLTAHAGLDDCPGISPQKPFLIRRFDSE